jgi:hypothetical protein
MVRIIVYQEIMDDFYTTVEKELHSHNKQNAKKIKLYLRYYKGLSEIPEECNEIWLHFMQHLTKPVNCENP